MYNACFDMQHDHIPKKKIVLVFATPPNLSPHRGSDQGLKSRLLCFISIVPLPACKILTIDLVTVKFKYLTFDPT